MGVGFGKSAGLIIFAGMNRIERRNSMREMIIALVATVPCVGFAQIDDMYYVPSKKATSASYSYTLVDEDEGSAEEVNYAGSEVRDVDEYNRRSSWAGDYEDEYGEDSIYYEEDEDGGYNCSKRILRFCTPTVGVAVSSPYYWDLCYGPNAIYWDVYDDGVYAYVFPASWSYVYWDPYYSFAWAWGGTWSAVYWSWWGYPWFGWYGGWRPHHYYGWGGRHYAGGRNLRYRQTNPIARSARSSGSRYATRLNGRTHSVSGTTSKGTTRSVGNYTRSSSSRGSSFTRSSSSSRSFSSPSRSSSFRSSGGGSRGGGVSRGGGGRR